MGELAIPAHYQAASQLESGMPACVARNYALLAQDIRSGSHTVASFDDAFALHQLIDAIEASAASGSRVTVE